MSFNWSKYFAYKCMAEFIDVKVHIFISKSKLTSLVTFDEQVSACMLVTQP